MLNGAYIPMYAEAPLSAGITALKFTPKASVVAFNVYGSRNAGAGESVTNISFTHGNLPGRMCGDVYVNLPQGTGRVDKPCRSVMVGLETPYAIPAIKPVGKEGLIYLAVNPGMYFNGCTVVVTTDKNVYSFSSTKTFDFDKPYFVKTIALDLSKADTVEPVSYCDSKFTDSNFHRFLLESIDANKDGKLATSETDLVEWLDCSKRSIKSLAGIEVFSRLKGLVCSNNPSIKLNVDNNVNLEELECDSSQLTKVDVAKCKALQTLTLRDNRLTEIDVSKNVSLINLTVSNNPLTALDVSKNIELRCLNVNNTQLTALDVSKNILLSALNCPDNKLSTIDFGENNELYKLDCSRNELGQLDLSNLTHLRYLYCDENKLTKLDLHAQEELCFLDCSNNRLTSLPLINKPVLDWLRCFGNHLSGLNVCQCAQEIYVNCGPQFIPEDIVFRIYAAVGQHVVHLGGVYGETVYIE